MLRTKAVRPCVLVPGYQVAHHLCYQMRHPAEGNIDIVRIILRRCGHLRSAWTNIAFLVADLDSPKALLNGSMVAFGLWYVVLEDFVEWTVRLKLT
jgi:hypothetical protein